MNFSSIFTPKKVLLMITIMIALVIILLLQNKNINPNPPSMTANNTQTEYEIPDSFSKSIWLWKSPLNITPQERQEYFKLLSEGNFTNIYIDITDYIDVYEGPDPKKRDEFTTKLREFVEEANRSDLSVEGLMGGTIWSQPDYEYATAIILEYVIEYNQQASDEQKLAGIQYDVESYNLPQFEEESEQSVILTDYLKMVERLTKIVAEKSPELRLGFAVPFWFDNVTRDLPLITKDGEEKPIGFHVIDTLNNIENGYIVIMDYRNKTEGENGSINLAKHEIEYVDQNASKVGVVIAQETTDVEPASITFFGQSESDLNKALSEIAEAFASSENLEGFAIHDIDGYRQLKKD